MADFSTFQLTQQDYERMREEDQSETEQSWLRARHVGSTIGEHRVFIGQSGIGGDRSDSYMIYKEQD